MFLKNNCFFASKFNNRDPNILGHATGKALVKISSKVGSCKAYCAAQSKDLECVGAWEDGSSNTCAQTLRTMKCDDDIFNIFSTSDAICECAPSSSSSTPAVTPPTPVGPSAYKLSHLRPFIT